MKTVLRAWIVTLSCYFVFGAMQTVAAESDKIIRYAQKRLTQRGYQTGPVDGLWGRQTQKAVNKFQRDQGLGVTGKLDAKTVGALGFKVIGKTSIGTATLRFMDAPILELSDSELLRKLKRLPIKYEAQRDIVLRSIGEYKIHSGHITQLIKDECIEPYEVGVGEMIVAGQTLRAANYGRLFPQSVEQVLNRVHTSVAHDIIKKSSSSSLLICTAAMF